MDSAELSRPQEKDLANDEANAETAEQPTEDPQTEEQQPKEIQVVDLSEENRDEGDRGEAGEEDQGDAGERDHDDAGTAAVRVEESQVEANATQQPQPQDNAAAKVVTSTKHRSKEDLELLKQTDPVSYLNAIIESKSSSDASQEVPTLSGKSTETSPLDEALTKVKAQFFKKDLMKALEGDPTAPSYLGAVLNAVDLLAVPPEVSCFIMELHSIIDQVSADYRRQRGFNSQLEVLYGKSSSAWTAVAETTSRIAELSKQKASKQEEVDAIDRENASLKAQIEEIEAKINANTKRKEELLSTVPDTESQAEITQGLEFAEKAQAFDDQIAKLVQANALCNKRLELQQAKYLRLKDSIPF